MIKRNPFFVGLFLLCMSMLMLQIIQTRILSVVSMYYLAFLSISMAMLGMTTGALLVHFKLSKITPANVASYLSRVATAFALAIFLCFLRQLASPLPIVKVGTLLVISLKVLVLLAAPFAVAGVAVSLALTRSPFPIGITYGVDLCGAAFGCLAVAALLSLGVQSPRDHIFLASVGHLATLIISRAPFSAVDLRVLRDTAGRLQFDVLASPDQMPTEPVFQDVLWATSVYDLNERASRYWLDISPPTDAPARSSLMGSAISSSCLRRCC
jgi:hypothetical protein